MSYLERAGVSGMRIVVYDLKNDRASMLRIGWINNATGSYVDAKYSVGDFNFSVPATEKNIKLLKKDRILYIDDFYWGIITGFKFEDSTRKTATITGVQLTGWMKRRVIIPPQINEAGKPLGYEAVSGSTETIMKYAIKNHMVNPADNARKIYGLGISKDLRRGNADDAYMYRYAALDSAIFEIGKAAKLGAKITGNPNKCEFMFDVIGQTDRTVNQTVNKPLILTVSRNNLETASYTYDDSDSYNTFYCTRSGSEEVWDEYVQTYLLDNQKKSGFERKETALTISVDSDSDNVYTEFEAMSRKDMESYRTVENLQAAMSRKLIYRKDYDLGTVSTVILPFAGIQADMEIISVETQTTDSATTYVATFGEEKISKFKNIERRLNK